MAKVIRGRPSRADTLRQNDRVTRFYAAMAGKEPAPETLSGVGPKRERARQPSGNVLEKDVLAAVLEALRSHPKVAWVARFNSGVFREGQRYIRASTQRGLSDILFMLVGGRMGACEVKSPTGIVAPHQQEFIDALNANGALAFVARSAEDVGKHIGA
jgi:hypothetical protein